MVQELLPTSKTRREGHSPRMQRGEAAVIVGLVQSRITDSSPTPQSRLGADGKKKPGGKGTHERNLHRPNPIFLSQTVGDYKEKIKNKKGAIRNRVQAGRTASRASPYS